MKYALLALPFAAAASIALGISVLKVVGADLIAIVVVLLVVFVWKLMRGRDRRV